MVSLYFYGTKAYFVCIGFIGKRPLVYSVYSVDWEQQLPTAVGRAYRPITHDQYEWVRNHLNCDVSFIPCDWPNPTGNLECRTHGCHHHVFGDDLIVPDLWDERQI